MTSLLYPFKNAPKNIKNAQNLTEFMVKSLNKLVKWVGFQEYFHKYVNSLQI